MAVKEIDPLTGHHTTGHEWDGITELNTAVPRAVWWFMAVTHLYAFIVWVLMPSWPLIWTYFGGILGIDQREQLEERVLQAEAARAVWSERIAAEPFETIRGDPDLMRVVGETAPALFGDNCSVCHGALGRGGPGYPSLADDDWLWGGDAETILETIRVGINSNHPETRVSEMLAFGEQGIITRDDIRTLVDYVQSLSGTEAPAEVVAAGEVIFADNCASCHAEDGTGMVDLGAPNLTDATWIYGGDDASMFETINEGRLGWMPAWEGRLSLADRKILAIHVEDLGGEGGQ